MRILVVGSGGREHAIAWVLSRSTQKPTVYVAPGNPGTGSLGSNVPVEATDIPGLLNFAQSEAIDLTIVGPEQPLVAGVVDTFEEAGLAIAGPSSGAARLEGSKTFAKNFMERHGIPTAGYSTFLADRAADARAYIQSRGAPIVVKASGLAAGKGAIVCSTVEEAVSAVDQMLVEKIFGRAGSQVVIEEFMTGEEASIFACCDGEDYVLLPSAQDHKRIGDGDTGPNTGGMGAYAPAPLATEEILEEVCSRIIEPVLQGMASEGNPYKGILYCGLMITPEGPKVVEFNCRLGDPEAQVILPLLESDAVDLFKAMADATIGSCHVALSGGAAACVVIASGGYPDEYARGFIIDGVSDVEALDRTHVFQAGTTLDARGNLVTAGGRVLGVTGTGRNLGEALEVAYAGVSEIRFEKMYYRRDIGKKGLTRQQETRVGT